MTRNLSPARPAAFSSGRYLDTPRRHDWRARAACRGVEADLFYPIGTTGPALVQIEEAKAVCRRCPVREVCLQWALETRDAHGVLGGTTAEERDDILGTAPAAHTEPPARPAPRPVASIPGTELASIHGADILAAVDAGEDETTIAARYDTTVYAVRTALRFLVPERHEPGNRVTEKVMRQADRLRALRRDGVPLAAIARKFGVSTSMIQHAVLIVAQVDRYQATRTGAGVAA